MITVLRSDSSGVYLESRTQTVKNILAEVKIYDSKRIDKIIDHKGILQIFWKVNPNEFDRNYFVKLWELFNETEIQHFIVNFKEI